MMCVHLLKFEENSIKLNTLKYKADRDVQEYAREEGG